MMVFLRSARLNWDLLRCCFLLFTSGMVPWHVKKTSSNHHHLGEGFWNSFPMRIFSKQIQSSSHPEYVLSWQSKDSLRPTFPIFVPVPYTHAHLCVMISHLTDCLCVYTTYIYTCISTYIDTSTYVWNDLILTSS